MAATFFGDSVLISDVEVGLQVSGPDLVPVRSISMDQAMFAANLHVTGRSVLVESTDTHNPGAALYEYSLDGGLLWSGGGFEPEQVAPFWGAFYQIHAAPVGERLFVASAMEYPLRVIDGDDVTAFGSPPPGYRVARRPERFEFTSPARRAEYEEFARSFTVISSIWETGGLLYVEHRDFDPAVSSHRAASYSADVYDSNTLEKLGEALPLPGAIMHASHGRIEALGIGPPTGHGRSSPTVFDQTQSTPPETGRAPHSIRALPKPRPPTRGGARPALVVASAMPSLHDDAPGPR